MSTTYSHSESRPGLFKRIGDTVRRVDQVLAEASLLRARWHAVSGLDTKRMQALSGDRFIG